MRWLALLLLAGCAPHYLWVEEPAAPPPPTEEREGEAAESERPEGWPCLGTTRAVRQQARMNRYRGPEGFDSRPCVSSGAGD